jgi:hypothetical protein
MALRGTGVWTSVAPVEPEPPPPPPELEEPALAELVDDVREVPLKDVVALEEMPVEVLVLDKTVAVVLDVEDGDSAEVELLALLETDEVKPMLFGDSADVEDAVDPTPTVEEAVSIALPLEAVTPAPAPDEEPAVLDAVALEVLLVEEDWM